ncbi:MAG: hypothetical protein IPF59_00690 [Ignavibacteria bacterium]|nr:hypothetical protein [Ignavibacteria bacterium]MBK6418782.1 hypothetical protein [Ignavibacteria bacterium]MBK7411679.1 hypothetical protein [Ignavibacteria bacterium]
MRTLIIASILLVASSLMSSGQTGRSILRDGNTILTIDGGKTWSTIASPNRHGFYIDRLGRRHVTIDGGNSWSIQKLQESKEVQPVTIAVIDNALVLTCNDLISGVVTICDVAGRTIHESGLNEASIFRHDLIQSGVYFVALRTEKFSRTFIVTNIK